MHRWWVESRPFLNSKLNGQIVNDATTKERGLLEDTKKVRGCQTEKKTFVKDTNVQALQMPAWSLMLCGWILNSPAG
jgi:hypothetical protein